MDNLSKESWLNALPTKKLMTALNSSNVKARFVGGCVRDSLLGVSENSEIDIAIDCSVDETIKLLEAAGIRPIPIGMAHGTIGCVIDRQGFEITTLRVDVKTDGRHAETVFTKNWQEDAKRRDFTINAIYADVSGEIYDPLNGRTDLENKIVRFIGEPSKRIEEDYLRILRFFRFFAKLAEGDIDKASLKASAQAKEGLKKLSAERIQAEMFKLLICPRAPEALQLMAATDILPIILPQITGTELFAKMHKLMSDNFIELDPLRLFSALYKDKKTALADAVKLKLSKAQLTRLEKIFAADIIAMKSYLSVREVRKLLYLRGVECFCDKVWLGWALDENASNMVGWRALLALAESWERPKFKLNGQMVKAAGVNDGEAIGRIIREVEEWWVDADFIDDEFSIIERLKAVVQATIYNRH